MQSWGRLECSSLVCTLWDCPCPDDHSLIFFHSKTQESFDFFHSRSFYPRGQCTNLTSLVKSPVRCVPPCTGCNAQGQCMECRASHALVAGVCRACPANCARCTTASRCNVCAPGFSITAAGRCVAAKCSTAALGRRWPGTALSTQAAVRTYTACCAECAASTKCKRFHVGPSGCSLFAASFAKVTTAKGFQAGAGGLGLWWRRGTALHGWVGLVFTQPVCS